MLRHTGFRGLKARLVGRILSLGNRTLYGQRLPRLLDELARGELPPIERAEACMESEQGILVRILGWWKGDTR